MKLLEAIGELSSQLKDLASIIYEFGKLKTYIEFNKEQQDIYDHFYNIYFELLEGKYEFNDNNKNPNESDHDYRVRIVQSIIEEADKALEQVMVNAESEDIELEEDATGMTNVSDVSFARHDSIFTSDKRKELFKT
jgi:hypothetical protein